MHNFPPSIDWHLTTLIATVLGYIACGNFTVKEQIAIGNWILQIGQTVVTNSTYQDLIESRIIGNEKINLNSLEAKQREDPFLNQNFQQFYDNIKSQVSQQDLANLHEAIQRINQELAKIRAAMKK